MYNPKIALVTGGSRGLGRDAALSLARQGHDVLLTYQGRADAAAAVVAEIRDLGRRAAALQLDVATGSGFDDFRQQVAGALAADFAAERFDFLVNNAGVGLHASFADTTEAQFDQMVNVHLKSVFFLTQTLLPLLHDGGRIVNLSSGLARVAMPNRAAYGTVKGAVEVLTRYLALELGPRGITANVVAPGAIATDFSGGIVRDNPQVSAHIASITALGRVGQPEDIGGIVAFLCSDAARWITGQRIEASGGMHL